MTAKVKSFLLSGVLLCVLMAGFAQPPRPGARGRSALNGRWYLQPVLISDTAAGKVAEINFSPGQDLFTGNTGCNTMRGRFSATDSTITFDPNIVTTKMMCAGYDEPAFLQSLLRATAFEIKNGFLVLLVDGQEISRWGRKKPVAPTSGTT